MSSNAVPSSAIERVQTPKTAELVSEQLRRKIVRGELAPGDALPPESELLKQFGISRPTLREALRMLESEQLITVRRGARGGARVCMPTPDVAARQAGLVLQFRGTTLEDVYHARTLIEQQCARLLAKRRTKSDLARLWAEVERGESVLHDPNLLIRVHTEFHALVVELAGSQTLQLLNGMLRHIVDTGNFARIAEDIATPSVVEATRKGARAHRRLVELIEERNAEAAEALWSKHLTEADRYLVAGNAKTILDLLA